MIQGTCPTCGGPLDPHTGVCPQCVTYAKTPSNGTPALAGGVPAEAGAPSIPGYRILEKLGEGGMGALYLAEETSLGRRVAIKLISHRIAGDASSTARFLREARTLATVEHPNVVRVYSFGEVAGTPYLVMEYVEGETLAQRLGRAGRLPVDEALRMTRQIVDALEAAWERKIVHRDIKPSNILLDRRNQVRVADFGLAKPAHEEASDYSLTNTNAMVGTPHYVSPEQAQGKDVDFRSDVYSLGIMLYQMLTGERPFEGTTPVAVIAKHLHEPLPPLIAKRPEAGASVERVVRAMTEKDPSKRPQSYAKIHQALDSLLGTTPSNEMPTLAQTIEAPRVRAPLVRMPLIYFAAVAIPLAILFATTKKLPKARYALPHESRLVVAVAPFYGPDDDSAREGKVMAALIEREILQKLGTENVRVIGIDETKKPLHTHDEARALAASTSADAVIWGDAFALRKETEIQPHVTVIPNSAPQQEETQERAMPRLDDASLLRDRGGATVKLAAESPNQIELRRTSAAGIGAVITLLAGIHALDIREPQRALDLFQKAPQTAETLRYEVQALLALDKNAAARATLERATALEPNDAGSQALVGDLLAADGKLREAAEAYTRANALNAPFRTQRGIVANGRLYIRETYRSIKYTQNRETDTVMLLGIDPATDRVVERYYLPGIPQTFEPRPGGFAVSWIARDQRIDQATFRNGKFDRYLWQPTELLLRLGGLKSATMIASNFMDGVSGIRNFHDKKTPQHIGPSKKMEDDAPKTYAELESALRARMERDPTLPWNPFLLAITLDAEGRHAEANAAFEQLLRGKYDVPFYEYSWMHNLLERMRKDAWADAVFNKALEARRRTPQPAVFCTLIERVVNANFGRQAACNADMQRGYPVLQHARLLTGLSGEGEDLASAGWVKYFRAKGDTAAAEREQAVLEKARSMSLNFYGITAKLDYALDFIAAAVAGYVFVMLAIVVAAYRRARIARTSSRRTPARVPAWLDVVVFALLAIGVAYYVAAKMREMNPPAVVLTIALGVLTALIIHARTSHRFTLFDLLAAITQRERFLLIAAWAMLMIAACIGAWRAEVLNGIRNIPIGLSDAPGHPHVVRQIERLIKDRQPAPGRLLYLGAVVNHFGGNTARAKQLYGFVSTAAAAANLQALSDGKMPVVPLNDQQVYEALAPASPGDVIEGVFENHPNAPVLMMLLSVPVALLLLARPRDDVSPAGEPHRFKLVERIALAITPGGYDLAVGAWARAYVVLFAAGFVIVPLLTIAREPRPMVGPITKEAITNIEVAFPMPFDERYDPFAYARWAQRFAFPYGKLFWFGVAALAALALALHLLRLPLILRGARKTEDELPTVISAAEL